MSRFLRGNFLWEKKKKKKHFTNCVSLRWAPSAGEKAARRRGAEAGPQSRRHQRPCPRGSPARSDALRREGLTPHRAAGFQDLHPRPGPHFRPFNPTGCVPGAQTVCGAPGALGLAHRARRGRSGAREAALSRERDPLAHLAAQPEGQVSHRKACGPGSTLFPFLFFLLPALDATLLRPSRPPASTWIFLSGARVCAAAAQRGRLGRPALEARAVRSWVPRACDSQ